MLRIEPANVRDPLDDSGCATPEYRPSPAGGEDRGTAPRRPCPCARLVP
ncbi:hypothetical protein [Streptomyces minutiscleroticus]